mgnify:FL=1
MTFGPKNILILWGKHLFFYGRCLLAIRGLEKLSKVSEITLVYQIGTQTIDFLCKDAAKNQKRCTFSQMEVKDIIRSVYFQILARKFSNLQGCLMSYNLSIAVNSNQRPDSPLLLL